MLTSVDVYRQITVLTRDLIDAGFAIDQNYPSNKTIKKNIQKIGITDMDFSISLKNISYKDMYYNLNKCRTYNIKMIDGALITMLYTFKNGELIAHRLAFFPSPDLEAFQNDPEPYINDDMYIEILDKRIVTVPLRFDYDSSEVASPIDHPVSHLTIGQYKNCRIPVYSAITPYQFLTFLLRNFYHTPYLKKYKELTEFNDKFSKSIFSEEQKLIHINTPI